MVPRWTVAIVVVLAVAGVVTPAIATSATDDRAEQRDPFEPLPSNATDVNDTMGSQITAFMQSSAIAVNNSVETGLWIDQFNASKNRTSMDNMVDQRATVLENRLERLRAELNETNATNITDPADARRLASLRARIDALNSTLQRTEQAASDAGVNTTRLERLRDNASRLHGQDVARIARNLTTVGPPADTGPPDNRGPPGENPPGHAENGTQGPPTDSGENGTHGPPTDQPAGPDANGTRGSPTDQPAGPGANGTKGPSANDTRGPGNGQGPSDQTNGTDGHPADASPDQNSNATRGPPSDHTDTPTETNSSDPRPPESGTDTPDGTPEGQPDGHSLSVERFSDRLYD